MRGGGGGQTGGSWVQAVGEGASRSKWEQVRASEGKCRQMMASKFQQEASRGK
jgi:hypothetical protein